MSEEWIEWNGGECPVPGDTLVDLKFADKGSCAVVSAGQFDWGHCDNPYFNIIAYRIVQPDSGFAKSEKVDERVGVEVGVDAPKTLRDEFAMAALTGLSSCGELPITEAVKFAYLYADAMLEARKQ